jgi:hypothetical protein
MDEHELRFIVERGEAVGFFRRAAGRLTEDVFDASRPVAYTRTTYLDTDRLDFFHGDGGLTARRVRVREYALATSADAPARLTGLCVLELKETAGSRRAKVRYAATPERIARILESGAPDGDCPRELGEVFGAGPLTPCIATWYRRLAFSGADGGVRVTLDLDLAFCRPRPLGEAGELAAPGGVLAEFPRAVLEVKWGAEAPAWLRRALRQLQPAWSFSKFHTGMIATTDARTAWPALVEATHA